nr:hypothetical protein [Tolivirales sp.]
MATASSPTHTSLESTDSYNAKLVTLANYPLVFEHIACRGTEPILLDLTKPTLVMVKFHPFVYTSSRYAYFGNGLCICKNTVYPQPSLVTEEDIEHIKLYLLSVDVKYDIHTEVSILQLLNDYTRNMTTVLTNTVHREKYTKFLCATSKCSIKQLVLFILSE